MTTTIDLRNLAATEMLGRRLGCELFPGAVVALVGQLGAGKTHLCRAIAEGLGVTDGNVVTSPTFVLVQEYEGRLPIYHFDAYRLRDPIEFAELGAEEYFAGKGVCLIEWADRVRQYMPSDYLNVELSVLGTDSRRVDLKSTGPRHARIIEALLGT